MSADKSGSPPCGIYMRIDDFSNMLDLIGHIRQMAFTINRSSGYEKNMSVVEVAFTPENAERAADMIPVIQAQGLVAILHGSFDPLGADGILLDKISDVAKAREALGDDAIIGVICADKGDIDAAIEQGVDYGVLRPDAGLIAAWKVKTDALCIVRGKSVTNANCGDYVRYGADFVDVSDYILKHEKGIMQGTVNILHAIDMAVAPPDIVN